MSDIKNTPEVTPEQAKEVLSQLGVKQGEWGETEERFGVPLLMSNQADALLRIRDMLQKMAEDDAKKVAALREQLARLQHGGGV